MCGDSFSLEFELANLGTDTLNNVSIAVNLNGIPVDTINWEGLLQSGGSVTLAAEITGALDGLNTLTIVTFNPNGISDQRPDNDAVSREIEVLLDGV